MVDVPRIALFLGLAGLIPFIWGAATLYAPGLAEVGIHVLGPRFVAPHVQLFYGAIILAFMSGVLWGFATKAKGRTATIGYVLSVLPALWAFFMVGGGPVAAAINLAAGFIALLGIDYVFWKLGLAPPWWIRLRVPLTVIIVACLGVTAL